MRGWFDSFSSSFLFNTSIWIATWGSSCSLLLYNSELFLRSWFFSLHNNNMFHHFPMSCRQLTSQVSSWVQFSATTMTFEVSIPWLQAHLEPLLEWVSQFLRTRSTVLSSSLAFWWSLIFLDPSCHLWFAPLWIATPVFFLEFLGLQANHQIRPCQACLDGPLFEYGSMDRKVISIPGKTRHGKDQWCFGSLAQIGRAKPVRFLVHIKSEWTRFPYYFHSHSMWIELLFCFPFSDFFWAIYHSTYHVSWFNLYINSLILDVACSMFFSMAAQLRQEWSTSIFQVLNVEPDSPADIAGLRPTLQSHQGIIIGDEILSVDGKDRLTDKLW